MSKIIVLAGSPRKNGNTDMPAEAFARGNGKRLLAEIEQYYSGKRYELFTSTRSKDNIRLYLASGYREFARKAVDAELEFVFMEK